MFARRILAIAAHLLMKIISAGKAKELATEV
jgi:hypothetical protein